MGEFPELIPAFGLERSNFDHEDDEDVDFLVRLQEIHDQVRSDDDTNTPGSNWGPGGLNENGRAALDDIAETFWLERG